MFTNKKENFEMYLKSNLRRIEEKTNKQTNPKLKVFFKFPSKHINEVLALYHCKSF